MDDIIRMLVEQWMWDVEQLSNPWMYYPLLVPVSVFLGFMCVKWVFLTLPMWLPVAIIAQVILHFDKCGKDEEE